MPVSAAGPAEGRRLCRLPSPPGNVRTPTMDRMKSTKGAGYAATAALMLALAPLILALPASADPCDPGGSAAPARACPTPPGRPGPSAAPVPAAGATVVPKSPSIPSGAAPALRTSVAPEPEATPKPPPVDAGTLPPAEAPSATASPAVGTPSPAAGPAAAATPASGDRGVPGAILLALGGLLVAAWAFLAIRKSA